MNVSQRQIVEEDCALIAQGLKTVTDQLDGASILLTGANGYLAGYIVDVIMWLNKHVLATPCHLTALVRRSTTRIQHVLDSPNITLVAQDVAAPLLLEGPFDYIIHAASNASPKKYLVSPIDTARANSIATDNLLQLANRVGTGGFLFFSSSETYGDVPSDEMPIKEDYVGRVDPHHPRAVYVESKRFGETLCLAYFREQQVPIKIVRPFHVYGPGQTLDDGRVTADLLRNRLNHDPLTLLSAGLAVRSFCYIADAVLGFMLVLLAGQPGEAYNIGDNREPISIRDFATLLASIEEPQLDVKFADNTVTYGAGSPSVVQPSLAKAADHLNYAPAIDLKAGLLRTLRWNRS